MKTYTVRGTQTDIIGVWHGGWSQRKGKFEQLKAEGAIIPVGTTRAGATIYEWSKP